MCDTNDVVIRVTHQTKRKGQTMDEAAKSQIGRIRILLGLFVVGLLLSG